MISTVIIDAPDTVKSGNWLIASSSIIVEKSYDLVVLIDDVNQVTLMSFSSRNKELEGATGTKSDKSFQVGEGIAKLAMDNGITEVCFDRGGYLYHGRVKQLAEGARKGGLKF